MSTTTTAYGSITIVDITDVGEFSVYPMSNSPLSVVYNPNQNTYVPDWSVNNLVLEPMVYYAGKKMEVGTTGLEVTWKRKDGIGPENDLTSEETFKDGKLTVSANKLAIDGDHKNSSGLLTYICSATYKEPESGTELKATGQITFSLIKHATNVKKCTISGENVFKYNSSNVLINGTKDSQSGGTYHTLTATANNVSIKQWEYKDANGDWAEYPKTEGYNNSITEITLKVFADEKNVFINDVATIRITTNDTTVYDICTVVKLKDGAPGSTTISAVLNNDDQWIACDDDGKPLNNPLQNVSSTITIYEGSVDDTANWVITCTPTNATGAYDEKTHTYSVHTIADNNASIEFKCEKENCAPIFKVFSLTKLKAAKDGETPIIYSISPSTIATNRTIAGVYTPDSVTFNAYSKEGNNERIAYNGRFEIFADNQLAYRSPEDESSYKYTFSSSNLKSLRCVLYKAGGTTTQVDSQTVIVTCDGNTGSDGAPGEKGDAAINVVLGNQADIIPCFHDGKVKSDMTLSIPFTGYLGTKKTACTVVATGLPTSMSVAKNTPGTSASGGMLELSVSYGAVLSNADSGVITLTFTCEGEEIVHYYQWSKSIQALDGENSILFEIYAPNGNIIHNRTNTVTLRARLIDGGYDITDQEWQMQWYKYQGSQYESLNTEGPELIVNPEDVRGYASYKCEVNLPDRSKREAYYAVIDKSDPVQAHVYCSLGTQILNSHGYGAVYTKIFRNGEEIDAIKTERFLTQAPESANAGEFYYHLNPSAKTATLMKYNGSTWKAATEEDLPKATYEYTFRDKEGNVTTYNGNQTITNKVFYVDATLVQKKIVIDVEVAI